MKIFLPILRKTIRLGRAIYAYLFAQKTFKKIDKIVRDLNGMVSKKKILKLTRLPNRSGSVSN
jgi:hypothetical protein